MRASIRHYLFNVQALPVNQPAYDAKAMPRPKRPIDTSDPFGLKLNEVMADMQIPGDYRAVADFFGIKVQSLADWVKHGRIAKERYARLVEWSGKDLHWWFDVATPVHTKHQETPPSKPAVLREHIPNSRGSWPFSKLSPNDFADLPTPALAAIESFALGVISQHPARNDKAA